MSALDEARTALAGLTDDLAAARTSFSVWLGMLVGRTADGSDARRILISAETVVERVKAMEKLEAAITSAQAAVNAAREVTS